MNQETRKEIHEVPLENRYLRSRIERLDYEVGDLRVRVAYLEGVLKVLRTILVQRMG